MSWDTSVWRNVWIVSSSHQSLNNLVQPYSWLQAMLRPWFFYLNTHIFFYGPCVVALVCSKWSTLYLQPKAANVTDHTSKGDESESLHTTLVLFSANDEFTTKQDMCLCCGSFGKGPEGQLIMCSQCGQSYHPYCVGVKVIYSHSRGKMIFRTFVGVV